MKAFRYRYCYDCRKRCYATREAADADVARFALLPKGDKVPCRSYLGACGWWHITSRKAWEATS